MIKTIRLPLALQVIFKADSLTMDLLRMVKQGHPLLSVVGDLEWVCRDIGPQSPLPYTADETYLVITAHQSTDRHMQLQGRDVTMTTQPKMLNISPWVSQPRLNKA